MSELVGRNKGSCKSHLKSTVTPSAAAKDVGGAVYRGGFRYSKHLNPFSIRPTPNTQGPTRTDSVLCHAECSCEGHPKESFERVELCIEAGFLILKIKRVTSRYIAPEYQAALYYTEAHRPGENKQHLTFQKCS